ncbi:MAG: helicase C-terminal domain-containing protein [Oscillospiraceae bacterium]|nr:helicase C-terminal domain-containing protein [Oscillospiraceae bacterium]
MPNQRKSDKSFNVYDDIREKLVKKGISRDEIVFIHEANTEEKRAKLFEKMRSGEVRVLLGSTEKMGTGVNVQKRLIALHDLDAPWRPSEVGQTLRTLAR